MEATAGAGENGGAAAGGNRYGIFIAAAIISKMATVSERARRKRMKYVWRSSGVVSNERRCSWRKAWKHQKAWRNCIWRNGNMA